MQKDLLIIDKKVKGLLKQGFDEKRINELRTLMKKEIEIANPDFYKMVDDQQFIKYRDASLHRIDDYTQMATRTTLLNTDRAASEINEGILGNRVMEYFTKDPRGVKTQREVCKQVMSQTLFKKSLVATDSNASSILGVPLLATVKSKGGLGINCRHSVRNAGKNVLNQVNKILYLAEIEAV